MIQYVVNVEPKTIGKKELAEILGITESTLDKKIKDNLIPPRIEGYQCWFLPEVISWMQEKSQPLKVTRIKPKCFNQAN